MIRIDSQAKKYSSYYVWTYTFTCHSIVWISFIDRDFLLWIKNKFITFWIQIIFFSSSLLTIGKIGITTDTSYAQPKTDSNDDKIASELALQFYVSIYICLTSYEKKKIINIFFVVTWLLSTAVCHKLFLYSSLVFNYNFVALITSNYSLITEQNSINTRNHLTNQLNVKTRKLNNSI